jgi:diguanylate cyclase (GGDEF)-like protein/PAS domain S-box-containing protein
MPAFQDPEICRDILNGLQIGVSVLDLQKKIVFWSDGAEQITGYSRLDVLGHPCTDNILVHCNQSSCEMCSNQCPISSALRAGKPVETVSFIQHKSGHRTPVHTWAIPLRDKHGSIIGVIQTFEGEVAINGPDPNDQSMKERGWLDNTTGLPNQMMMLSHLRETLGSFSELHIPFGVIGVQVQELQQLRARYGQEAATCLLQVLARTLRNTVWPSDYVGRWDESQFMAILCGCGEDALHAVAARMRRMMSSATIVWWGEELSAKVSIGCASAVVGDSVDSLMQRTRQPDSVGQAESAMAAGAPRSKS